MYKNYFYIIIVLLFGSCEYISSLKKDTETPIAKVYDKFLYEKDIIDLLPSDLSKQDSILFVKNHIESWAKHQLLLHQAEINLTDNVPEYEKLVTDYRSTLYINSYKEALVLDKLDTIVRDSEIENYYAQNNNNFKLNEELVQLKYIHTSKNVFDKKKLIKLFKSSKLSDLDSLQQHVLEFKSYNLNDSIWMKYNDLLTNIDFFKTIEKEKFLKKSNFIQKEDSLGLYLTSVKKVLYRTDIAPLGYVKPKIKQIILQKRKLELLRKIEVDLLNNAVKNQYFENYRND